MGTTKLLQTRDAVPESEKWDLTPLFKNESEWEDLFSEIEKNIDIYKTYQGRLEESAEMLYEVIAFDLDISRKTERLYTYAHLRSDEDKTNQHYLALYERALTLYNRLSEVSSFITPEIQSIPNEKIEDFLKDEKLNDYSFFLEKIIRYKPHTLSKEIEEVLAMSGEIAQGPSQFFSQLDNADLKFGTLKNELGEEIELTHGNFITFLMKPDRQIRKKSFNQYYSVYENHKHCIAASLSLSAKKDYFYTRTRKFKSCRGAALFSDNIPHEVYDTLISTVKDNLAPLFKYLDFRKKVLGLDELHFYDTYVPLVSEVDFHMPFKEAVDTCIRALEKLGSDYTRTLKKGLLGGWVDRYENRGKRSGAYSSGCYDSPPYILMNYREDNINSLYTLIHEAGHSMHSYYSIQNQPYHYHGYTIFVAEVASTFNEALLSSYLLDLYKDDPKMQAYILNREIDNIRGTLFRQTMFAEFEKLSHNALEEKRPLTLDALTGIYRTLLETYFGNTMVIDDALTLECLRIPHFYSAFYVYKYATGLSAALALSDKVLNEEENAHENYIKFLKLGGSMFPLEELAEAGVDMRNPEPVEEALKHFGQLVERFSFIYTN